MSTFLPALRNRATKPTRRRPETTSKNSRRTAPTAIPLLPHAQRNLNAPLDPKAPTAHMENARAAQEAKTRERERIGAGAAQLGNP